MTFTITDKYMHPLITVDARALDALKRALESRSNEAVIDLDAPVVVSPKGCNYVDGKDSYHNYTGDLRVAIREWNAAVGWRVKDLRKAVPTALAMAGLSSDVTEMYIGHAPPRHYGASLHIKVGRRDQG